MYIDKKEVKTIFNYFSFQIGFKRSAHQNVNIASLISRRYFLKVLTDYSSQSEYSIRDHPYTTSPYLREFFGTTTYPPNHPP